MLKVCANSLWLFLDTAQAAKSCLDQLQLCPGGRLFCHRLFDVGVRHFVGVELRAVAGQVDDAYRDAFCLLAQDGVAGKFDETQDFGPQAIRLLRAMVTPGQTTCFL